MHVEVALRALDELIEARSILNHPFYRAWERGELTQEQLATYARVYYPHVAAFPRYLEQALAGADNVSIREELERNLDDELHVPKAHSELWLDFAAALGLERQQIVEAEPHPAVKGAVESYSRLTSNSTAGALAALYAYEAQQPEVSLRKADGLIGYYGIEAPEALAYFGVHAEADLEHRAGERRALGHLLETGASGEEVLDAAEQALDAYWALLDSVCDEAEIPSA